MPNSHADVQDLLKPKAQFVHEFCYRTVLNFVVVTNSWNSGATRSLFCNYFIAVNLRKGDYPNIAARSFTSTFHEVRKFPHYMWDFISHCLICFNKDMLTSFEPS